MAKENRFQHFVFRNFICTGFDHNDLLSGRSNSQIQIRDLSLCARRVDDKFTIHQTDRNSANRTIERDIGNGNCDGRSQHRKDLRLAVLINRKNRVDQRNIIAVILREKRTHGTIDAASSQNCIFAGTSFSFQETSGDLAHGVHFFFIIDREREEIDSLSGLFGMGSGGDDGGIPVRKPDSSAGLLSHFSDFSAEFATGKLHFKNL